jgi:chemotaxis response regulator CheB
MDDHAPEPGIPGMVGIVAASGGPQAIKTILSELPHAFPFPVLVIQGELGPRAVAAILTGMGADGAEGMKAVRDSGRYTIARDESTLKRSHAPRRHRP